jgi:hypothetical protein
VSQFPGLDTSLPEHGGADREIPGVPWLKLEDCRLNSCQLFDLLLGNGSLEVFVFVRSFNPDLPASLADELEDSFLGIVVVFCAFSFGFGEVIPVAPALFAVGAGEVCVLAVDVRENLPGRDEGDAFSPFLSWNVPRRWDFPSVSTVTT